MQRDRLDRGHVSILCGTERSLGRQRLPRQPAADADRWAAKPVSRAFLLCVYR
jgi:hypothetical protein